MKEQSIDPRQLRSAIEFAVAIAREGQKIRPPLAFPPALRRYFTAARIPSAALAPLRRAIEQDDAFRSRLAVGVQPDLVDEVGVLWLQRPEGWESAIREAIARAESERATADLVQELKRSDRRREAAEQAAIRTRAELAAMTDQARERSAAIDQLRADVAKLNDVLAELRIELADTRTEARHARDREVAAADRLKAALADRADAVAAQGRAESVRDGVLADRAELVAERSDLARLAVTASALADQLAALSAGAAAQRTAPIARTPLPIPGGVIGDSQIAAEYLMRSGASIVIDGYNIAKTAWPALDLEGQRVVLLDAAENLAKRFGSDLTVVFDGAGVAGASADRRRIVRVVYSPADVIADDVIRDEVRRLPPTRAVVVITDDQQVVRDVRQLGANTMTARQLLDLTK